jgi:thioredoxin reductase (NADPH)
VEKAQRLAQAGKIRMLTNALVTGLHGNGRLESVTITNNDGAESSLTAEHYIPLFGLSPKLGPIADWGLGIERSGVAVDATTYQTSVEGVYAIGDMAEYPNKLKLILSGFHEAAVALNHEYQRLHPEKKHVIKYTTVTGISELA